MDLKYINKLQEAINEERYTDAIIILDNNECYDVLRSLWHMSHRPRNIHLQNRELPVEISDSDWKMLAMTLNREQRSSEISSFIFVLFCFCINLFVIWYSFPFHSPTHIFISCIAFACILPVSIISLNFAWDAWQTRRKLNGIQKK